MKILIVDDEELIRKGLKKIIQRLGAAYAAVEEAATGKAALELIAKEIPDLVITDIKMPELDGISLIKHLNQRFPQIKKVVLSGFDEFQLVRETLKNGALDYLLKPVDEGELQQLLASLCQEKVCQGDGSLDIMPFQPQPVPDNSKKDNRLIESLKDYLNCHYHEPITLSKIADNFGINPNYLCERFKQQTGEHFVTYLTRLRIEQAKLLLENVTVKAYEVGFMVGYDDPTYFSKVFKKVVGLTPTEYRQKRSKSGYFNKNGL